MSARRLVRGQGCDGEAERLRSRPFYRLTLQHSSTDSCRTITLKLANELALVKLELETEKANRPNLIRAAEDAAYETAARNLERYADVKLSGVAYSATVVCGNDAHFEISRLTLYNLTGQRP